MKQLVNEHQQNTIDHLNAAIAVGVITDVIPIIIGVLTIIWYSIRIGEWIYNKLKSKNQNCKEKTDGE